jgi:hypothetical protein
MEQKSTKAQNMKKKQKQAQKRALANALVTKNPVESRAPSKRVGKNSLALARSSSVMLEKESMLRTQIEKVILSVTAPMDFPPFRLGARYGSAETAVANPLSRKKATFIPRVEEPGPTVRTCSVFVFRDPYRFSISEYSTGASAPVYYYSWVNVPITISGQSMPLEVPPLNWTGFNGPAPHSSKWYPGRLPTSSRSYFFLDAGNTVSFQNTTAIPITFTWYTWSTPGETKQQFQRIVNPGLTDNFLILSPDYYGWNITGNGLTGTIWNGNITITLPSNASVWAHQPLPYLDRNDSSADAVRIYGASILFTNDASPLNRQGKLAAAQMPSGRDWREYTHFSDLADVRNCYVSDAVNGYYGFLKPTDPKDSNFINDSENTTGAVDYAWYDLSTPSDFLALAVNVVPTEGQDATLTVSAAVEYRTTDQWRDTKLANVSAAAVEKAFEIVSMMPQHHENPLHLEDIWNFVKDAANTIYEGFREALPVIVKGASTVGNIAGALSAIML